MSELPAARLAPICTEYSVVMQEYGVSTGLKKVGLGRLRTVRTVRPGAGITSQEIKISSAILTCTTESGMQCIVVSDFPHTMICTRIPVSVKKGLQLVAAE